MALNQGQIGETYNISGVNEWTNIDIVKLICQLMNERFSEDPALAEPYPGCPATSGASCETLITYVTDRAGHDFRYAIDTTRIKNELGYSPAITFETGIRKTLDWYLANPEWWRAVLDGSYRTFK